MIATAVHCSHFSLLSGFNLFRYAGDSPDYSTGDAFWNPRKEPSYKEVWGYNAVLEPNALPCWLELEPSPRLWTRMEMNTWIKLESEPCFQEQCFVQGNKQTVKVYFGMNLDSIRPLVPCTLYRVTNRHKLTLSQLQHPPIYSLCTRNLGAIPNMRDSQHFGSQ